MTTKLYQKLDPIFNKSGNIRIAYKPITFTLLLDDEGNTLLSKRGRISKKKMVEQYEEEKTK